MLYNVCSRQVWVYVREKIADSGAGTCTVSTRQQGYIVSEDDTRPRHDIFTSFAIVDQEVPARVSQSF